MRQRNTMLGLMLKAYEEYDKYRVIQDRLYMSDFDKEVKRLKDEMGMSDCKD